MVKMKWQQEAIMGTIDGYTFDGAIYCPACCPQPEKCKCNELDENGLCLNNCHGYGPQPIFSTDELEPGDSCCACGLELCESDDYDLDEED